MSGSHPLFHPEPDRETPYRRWYFGLSHGRVGRRQNKSSCDIKTSFQTADPRRFFYCEDKVKETMNNDLKKQLKYKQRVTWDWTRGVAVDVFFAVMLTTLLVAGIKYKRNNKAIPVSEIEATRKQMQDKSNTINFTDTVRTR